MELASILFSHVLLIGAVGQETPQLRFAVGDQSPASMEPQTAERSPDEEKAPDKWIFRWVPDKLMHEVGLYAGILALNRRHELFDVDITKANKGYKPLQQIGVDLGLRYSFYPWSFLGVEVEAGLMPFRLEFEQKNALLWSTRGHLVFQLPISSVVPFIVAGGGALGVASKPSALGNDVDESLHFGGGLKFYLNRYMAVRFDVRDILSHQQGTVGTLRANSLEVLLGFSGTFGRAKPKVVVVPIPKEERPKDSDGDGFSDLQDQCPYEAEFFNSFQDEDGCPEVDSDGDGFWNIPNQDKCPNEAGVAPDGCPIVDTDGDGFMDPDDKCIQEAETINGYEDQDGCPDEVPKEVEKFMGVIDGIHFDTNLATIRPDSGFVLQQAVDIMNKYESVRVEISGHTDNVGQAEANQMLSLARAEAVKSYMVERGVDPSRIEVRGAGFDEPIATNKNEEGRSLNRRIEFKILTQ